MQKSFHRAQHGHHRANINNPNVCATAEFTDNSHGMLRRGNISTISKHVVERVAGQRVFEVRLLQYGRLVRQIVEELVVHAH